MAQMKRHTDKLSAKAKKCVVTRDLLDPNAFSVKSPSGSTYTVEIDPEDPRSMSCECKWAEYHPWRACSHQIAVQMHLEAEKERKASVFQGKTKAQRQHRPMRRMNDLWITSRKVA